LRLNDLNIHVDLGLVDLSNSQTVPVHTPARDKPDAETLARMLAHGVFPENYDDKIRELSDDDFERLWEIFYLERSVSTKGIVP
jgi:hypothetical protein